MFRMLISASAMLASLNIAANAAGDPSMGAAKFNQRCKACHAIMAGKTIVGPSLFGVVGRHAGSVPGYGYSKALANSHMTWTPGNLSTYLAGPHRMIEGNKMGAMAMSKSADIDNVVAYLETLK